MSSPDRPESGCMVIILVAVFALGITTGVSFEYGYRLSMKKQAVERGVAEWVTSSSGGTTWKWKESNGTGK